MVFGQRSFRAYVERQGDVRELAGVGGSGGDTNCEGRNQLAGSAQGQGECPIHGWRRNDRDRDRGCAVYPGAHPQPVVAATPRKQRQESDLLRRKNLRRARRGRRCHRKTVRQAVRHGFSAPGIRRTSDGVWPGVPEVGTVASQIRPLGERESTEARAEADGRRHGHRGD
uniref:(northern house mosquito) hypothetical protein n=1 Tax=Culex pipiens TaxID=7175 RepID=A0A8D8B8I2_CULPI